MFTSKFLTYKKKEADQKKKGYVIKCIKIKGLVTVATAKKISPICLE